jgi:bleomycin hydrolase
MTDSWFDEYLYEIVIDKKYLSEELIKLYDTTPVELAPWDPMGALALRREKI